MNEKSIIRKQILKNMLFNFIIFTTMFTIFGTIIYTKVSDSIYQSANEKLVELSERVKPSGYVLVESDGSVTTEKKIAIKVDASNVICIGRTKEGEILNYDLNEAYSVGKIDFDANVLDTIYDIKIKEIYHYRGINYKLEDETYMQLLINVDSENHIMEMFSKVLLIAIVVCIIISVVASYILSKIAFKPVQRAWKKQTEFVQNVSHELRTPISIIQGTQEILLDTPNSKLIDKFEDVNHVLMESKRLSKMIEDLMLLSMSDANKIEIEKEEVDLENLIKEVSAPYIEYVKQQDKQIKVNVQCKIAKVDSDRLKQVLIILLDNAIKYTNPNDTIEIIADEKEGKVRIQVKDTGIGMKKEDRKNIFDRFYRVDKARSRETGGSGLGLSIAKCIILQHKGSIKAEENKPKGTCMEIKLPKR